MSEALTTPSQSDFSRDRAPRKSVCLGCNPEGGAPTVGLAPLQGKRPDSLFLTLSLSLSLPLSQVSIQV